MPEISSGSVHRASRAPRGGFLLGRLLRLALAAAELLAVDDGGAGEASLVRRPFDRDLDVRHVPAAAGEQPPAGRSCGRRASSARARCARRTRRRRVLDRREAVLEEERAERRLDAAPRARCGCCASRSNSSSGRVGRPSTSRRPRSSSRATTAQRCARDDVRAHLREPPLREVGMPRVERVRDRELEDAVAEELEPLVRGASGRSPTTSA